MNTKLFFSAIASAMSQDHVGPQEIITSMAEVANQVANAGGSVFFAYCTSPAEKLNDDQRMNELAQQFAQVKANFEAVGYSYDLIDAVLYELISDKFKAGLKADELNIGNDGVLDAPYDAQVNVDHLQIKNGVTGEVLLDIKPEKPKYFEDRGEALIDPLYKPNFELRDSL